MTLPKVMLAAVHWSAVVGGVRCRQIYFRNMGKELANLKAFFIFIVQPEFLVHFQNSLGNTLYSGRLLKTYNSKT